MTNEQLDGSTTIRSGNHAANYRSFTQRAEVSTRRYSD